ncbi:MAG: hypothetical protein QOG94_2028 [Solirubrobacteraceae bacterium]|jgi:hypothetical protein|nr:hypothetical protein [Solirubrobacteraceae bacterium]
MEDMFRLDFSRGTVDKIDSSIPPRGWHDPSAGTERETPPRGAGYSFGAPATAPRAEQDEE